MYSTRIGTNRRTWLDHLASWDHNNHIVSGWNGYLEHLMQEFITFGKTPFALPVNVIITNSRPQKVSNVTKLKVMPKLLAYHWTQQVVPG